MANREPPRNQPGPPYNQKKFSKYDLMQQKQAWEKQKQIWEQNHQYLLQQKLLILQQLPPLYPNRQLLPISRLSPGSSSGPSSGSNLESGSSSSASSILSLLTPWERGNDGGSSSGEVGRRKSLEQGSEFSLYSYDLPADQEPSAQHSSPSSRGSPSLVSHKSSEASGSKANPMSFLEVAKKGGSNFTKAKRRGGSTPSRRPLKFDSTHSKTEIY
ncbi:hypothetical protein Droror1_Dr00013084 [Drosera rotundifolia]